MNTMVVDYRIVILALGLICLGIGIFLILRERLRARPYSAVVTGKLTGYEDIYETTKEGVQTISQRVFYPIFEYEVDGVSYKKSTSRQFFEQDERKTGVDVPVRYNPAVPSDCRIIYEEYPMLTPVLVTAVGGIIAIVAAFMLL